MFEEGKYIGVEAEGDELFTGRIRGSGIAGKFLVVYLGGENKLKFLYNKLDLVQETRTITRYSYGNINIFLDWLKGAFAPFLFTNV